MDGERLGSEPFKIVGRSLNPPLEARLPVRDRNLDSSVGDPEPSAFFRGDRSVWMTLGSMFSFRLGVAGRVGDLTRLGEAREGDPVLAGELLRAGGVES